MLQFSCIFKNYCPTEAIKSEISWYNFLRQETTMIDSSFDWNCSVEQGRQWGFPPHCHLTKWNHHYLRLPSLTWLLAGDSGIFVYIPQWCHLKVMSSHHWCWGRCSGIWKKLWHFFLSTKEFAQISISPSNVPWKIRGSPLPSRDQACLASLQGYT